MDSQCAYPSVRIVVKESHKRQNPLDLEEPAIWHTLDRLQGNTVIQSAAPLIFDQIKMRLEGHSRVWITATDEHNNLSMAKSSYSFLHQSVEVVNSERVKHASPALSGYTVPFHFVIPKWVLAKGRVPDQCLNLPPSISIGQTLPWPQEPEVYAQPNISYHLRALIKYHTSSESEPQTLEAWKEIRIIPITEIYPPTDTRDFNAEFVETQTQTFRTSIFGGAAYSMTLSIIEPPGVKLLDMRTQGTTAAVLIIDIEAADGNIDEKRLDRMPHILRKLTFNVESVFRAKTFYSSTPFAKLPGQTMLTLKGSMRLQDQVMKLATLCAKPESWQYLPRNQRPSYGEAVHRPSSQSARSAERGVNSGSSGVSPNPPRSWSALICVPLIVPADLTPTFCSALVSRQYSLIMRTRVSGLNLKPFTLEVPMQIIYSPPDVIRAPLASERALLDAASDVENQITEELPDYS